MHLMADVDSRIKGLKVLKTEENLHEKLLIMSKML